MKRKYKNQLKLIESNKGILLPTELKQPFQLQKSFFENMFGELGKAFDLLLEPILILVNTVMPIFNELWEFYLNRSDEFTIRLWLYQKETYFGW